MIKYTFTFSRQEEKLFRQILKRLEPEEYNVIEDIKPVDSENSRYSDLQTVIKMDSECALTFRMGMKELKIRRERTEAELEEEKKINDMHTVKVVVHVNSDDAVK